MAIRGGTPYNGLRDGKCCYVRCLASSPLQNQVPGSYLVSGGVNCSCYLLAARTSACALPNRCEMRTMHLGKSYTLSEFTFWSRRQIYASLVCSALPVFLYQFLGLKWLSIPVSVVVLLGTATSFIVGFRNVQTYGRALEAQQIWTEILNGSRYLGVMSRDFPAGAAAGRELILRHCAWLTALRYQLRIPRVWENAGKVANVEYQKYYRVPEWETPLEQALARYLPQSELDSVLQAESKTSRLLGMQAATIKRLLDTGEISNAFYLELGGSIRGFFAQQGRAERVKDYPYPRQY